MNTTTRKFAVGLASAALVASAAAPAFADDASTNTENTNTNTQASANRWAGEDRYETAIEVAKKTYPHGANSGAENVYIANGSDAHLVDAITGGALADGPVLLVNDSKDVQDKVKAVVAELRPNKVIALGEKNAVSDAVLTYVASGNGSLTDRLGGETRYETAVEIAKKVLSAANTSVDIFLANGNTQIDALAAGQAAKGEPILLTDGKTLPTVVANYLYSVGYKGATDGKADHIVALGGDKVVSQAEIETAVAANAGSSYAKYDELRKLAQDAAKAEMVKDGYLTVADGITAEDVWTVIAKDPANATLSNYFKLETSFPKVPKSIAAMTGTADLYKYSGNSSKTVETVPYANAIDASNQVATSIKSVEGENVYTYTGTAGAYADAQTRLSKVGSYQKRVANTTGTVPAETDDDAATWPVSGASPAKLTSSTANADLDAAPSASNQSSQLKNGIAAKLGTNVQRDVSGNNIGGLFGSDSSKAAAGENLLRDTTLLQALTPASPSQTALLSGASTPGTANTDFAVTLEDLQTLWPDKGLTAGTSLQTFLEKIGVTTNYAANGYKNAASWTEARNKFLQVVAQASKDATKAVPAAYTADQKAASDKSAADLKLASDNDFVTHGLVPTRLAGEDRYQTAVAIAKYAYGTGSALELADGTARHIYFVNGTAFADAAVSGTIDNGQNTTAGPVLLVDKDSISDAVKTYVAHEAVKSSGYAIGGTAVVSDTTLAAGQEAITKAAQPAPALNIYFGDAPATVSTVVDTDQSSGVDYAYSAATSVVSQPAGSTISYTVQYQAPDGSWKDVDANGKFYLTAWASANDATVTTSWDLGNHKIIVKSDGNGTPSAKVTVSLRVKAVAKNDAGTQVLNTAYSPATTSIISAAK